MDCLVVGPEAKMHVLKKRMTNQHQKANNRQVGEMFTAGVMEEVNIIFIPKNFLS